ncbi:MAG: hypothetical protein ACI841_000038, partial [Planctomycetota bacterium]
DVPLGSLDFEVREDPELAAELEGKGLEERARILLTAGYRSDARHLARDMPASAEMRALIENRLRD